MRLGGEWEIDGEQEEEEPLDSRFSLLRHRELGTGSNRLYVCTVHTHSNQSPFLLDPPKARVCPGRIREQHQTGLLTGLLWTEQPRSGLPEPAEIVSIDGGNGLQTGAPDGNEQSHKVIDEERVGGRGENLDNVGQKRE